MDTEIVKLFTEIKEDIGGLKQAMDLHNQTFAAHVLSDKAMCDDIVELKLAAAKEQGARKTWDRVMNAGLGIVGAVAGFFGAKHMGH